jgi:hypothetical protein
MISGRGTKINAGVHGAYLARSLRRLAKYMTSDERLVHKQVIIRQVLEMYRTRIDERIALGHLYVADFMNEIEGWLDQPTDENADRLASFWRVLDGPDGFDYRLQQLIEAALDRDQYWNFILSTFQYHVSDKNGAAFYQNLKAWQLEVAYAILTNQPIPPLGDPDAGR